MTENGKTIAEEIAELRAMPVVDLVERYEELHGKPPRSKNREWLWKRCAWKLQERRFGGLSTVAKQRLEELIAGLDLPQLDGRRARVAVAEPRRPGETTPGTTLTRVWRGQEVRATAVEGGRWEHEGVVYRSLSGLAKAVTGSHLSGRAFFGLAKRRGA